MTEQCIYSSIYMLTDCENRGSGKIFPDTDHKSDNKSYSSTGYFNIHRVPTILYF